MKRELFIATSYHHVITAITYPYTIIFSIIVIMIMLLSPELLWIMGGDYYVQAKYCLPPIIVGLVCQFIYSFYINAEFYLKKQIRIAIGTILAASINILLNIFLVPKFGYVIASYTTLAGYIILLLFHFFSLVFLGKQDWYDNRFNCFIILGFIALIPIMCFVYQYDLLRYRLIIILGSAIIMFIYIKKDKAIGLIKKITHK